MTGKVVTFYSYKGGVGRTFALANTAAVLARWGYRVLCVDWDLDAPGLVHYLRPWLAAAPARGVVELVAAHAAGGRPDPAADVVPVTLPDAAGRLDLIPAGAEDDGYVARAQRLDWAELYDGHGLGGFLEQCRTRWVEHYDLVLVDSRTGITDIGGICTAQLPDTLVMFFTANEQSVRGTLDVARLAWEAQDRLPYDRGGLQIVPVPSRFDAREEYRRAESWRSRFATEFGPLVALWASRDIAISQLISHLTVPYVSYWSFGEELPALVEADLTPDRIGYSLETLAALLAHRLDRTELLADSRDSFVAAAARGGRRPGTGPDVFLSARLRDRELADRIARAVRGRSTAVFLAGLDLAVGATDTPVVDEALTAAAHLVVLVGPDGLGPRQAREVERFLRQSLDEGSDRLVIPVLTPRANVSALPSLLAQFRTERLTADDDASVAAVAAAIVRDVSRGTGALPEGATVRAEARETLADLVGWELDPLRWQLIAQELGTAERAVADGDDPVLRAAVTDLELLGPHRAAAAGRDGVAMPADLRDRVLELLVRLGGQLDVTTAREAVTDRLERFSAGDHDAVLGDAALAEAGRYRLAAGDADPEAAFLLGLVHHLRSRVGGDGASDRAAAVRHFGLVFRLAPDQVPPALRDDVAAAVGAVDGSVRAGWSSRVAELAARGRARPREAAPRPTGRRSTTRCGSPSWSSTCPRRRSAPTRWRTSCSRCGPGSTASATARTWTARWSSGASGTGPRSGSRRRSVSRSSTATASPRGPPTSTRRSSSSPTP